MGIPGQAETMPTPMTVERRSWDPPTPMLPSEWAEKHRHLWRSNIPGPWRNANAPYLRGIMDISHRPGVVQVNLQKAGQIGGSEAMRNLLAFWAATEPDPVGLTLPDRDKGRKIVKSDIRPLFRRTPALRDLLAGSRDALIETITLLNGFRLELMWSGSSTSMASNPYRRVINDEVDKFAAWTGQDVDAVAATQVRLSTYGDRRLQVNISTPTDTGGKIHELYKASNVKLRYHVPCPLCGHYQVLTWGGRKTAGGMKWWHDAKDKDDLSALADYLSAHRDDAVWYECEKCRGRIRPDQQWHIVRAGRWTTDEGHVLDADGVEHVDAEAVLRWPNETRIGFQLSALYCGWLHWAVIVGEWLRAQGDPEALYAFVTNRLGEPFEFKLRSVAPVFFSDKRARAPLPEGIVPAWAWLLLMTVDTQSDHFYAVLRAWGPGLRSARVWHGRVRTWDELDKLLVQQWPTEGAADRPMTVGLCLIDSGGTSDRLVEASRTMQVYQYALARQGLVIAIKGDSARSQGGFYRPMREPMIVPGKQGEENRIRGVLVNTHHCNDLLAELMARGIPHYEEDGTPIPPTEPEAWMLNQREDLEYDLHMANVQKTLDAKTRDEVWTPRTPHSRHDYRDCENYQIAAAYLCNVHQLPEATTMAEFAAAHADRVSPRQSGDGGADGGGWAAPL